MRIRNITPQRSSSRSPICFLISMALPDLHLESLCNEAGRFAAQTSEIFAPELYGATDGKRVGTYLEHPFRDALHARYSFEAGSSAQGIDFPELGVDMKVTSIAQPQSSSPFRSARQKVYGLGYGLLLFVYEKTDDEARQAAQLKILHCIYIAKQRTADFQLTTQLRKAIENDGNLDDIAAILLDRNLPLDYGQAELLAEEILKQPPETGCLTISIALQWRLQYRRAILQAGVMQGVHRINVMQ